MKDIAEALDLSPTTVSHVLTGKHKRYRIGEDTVKRVQKMAEKLGFQSNAVARALKSHRTASVALVVGDLTNPFWSGVAIGAQHEAEQNGYTLFVCNTEDTVEREQRMVAMLQERRVDGLILSPTHIQDAALETLQKRGLPFVLVDRNVSNAKVPCVRTDNFAGSALAVDYLARREHRSIAFIGGPERIATFRDRLLGFKKALAERDLDATVACTIEPLFEESDKIVSALLKRDPRPRAFYTGNIWITLGAINAIQAAGLTVGKDLDLVGFDDIPRANLLRDPVTTVAQQVDAMGREAFKLLLKVMKGEKGARDVLLKPALIER
jgi:LacI family transcriptional regulator